MQASGTANALEASLTNPVKRTRSQSIEAGLSAVFKGLNDEVRSTATETSKKSSSVTASVTSRTEHAVLGYDGLTQGSASVSVGRLRFGDGVAKALDAAGANTDGAFAKLNLQASRVTALPALVALTTNLRAQLALNHKNMDGSERMSISGTGAVAAYPSGESSGDHVVFMRVELARPIDLAAPLQLSASAFASYGYAKAAKPLAGQSARELSDVGLGLSANVGGGLLRLVAAHRLSARQPVSEPAARTRVLVQGGWVF